MKYRPRFKTEGELTYLKYYGGSLYAANNLPRDVVSNLDDRLKTDEEKELARKLVKANLPEISLFVMSGYLGKHIKQNSMVVSVGMFTDFLLGKSRGVLTNVLDALEYLPESTPHIAGTSGSKWSDVEKYCALKNISRDTSTLYFESWSHKPCTVGIYGSEDLVNSYKENYIKTWGSKN